MYNIITFKGELMKKLLILTVLFSAKLFAWEQGATLVSAAQQEHANAYNNALHKGVEVQHAWKVAQAQPTAANVQALKDAIHAHSQTVDHCKQCVIGLQRTFAEANGKGYFHTGSAFTVGAPAA